MSLITNTIFEERYIALRKKENRIYSDEEVLKLPDISRNHPHYKEWVMRKQSLKRLMTWFEKKNKPIKILEVGCGNGWLCNHLSGIKSAEVTGLDINSIELQQAERVFKNNQHLKFVYGEIESGVLAEEKFDVVLLAASIQYFQSLQSIVNIAFEVLNEEGEVHVIDTHFYTTDEITNARKRSMEYFTLIGFPEMADQYFHHSIDELKQYNYRILYKPSFFTNKILGNNNPFPWVCVKRH